MALEFFVGEEARRFTDTLPEIELSAKIVAPTQETKNREPVIRRTQAPRHRTKKGDVVMTVREVRFFIKHEQTKLIRKLATEHNTYDDEKAIRDAIQWCNFHLINYWTLREDTELIYDPAILPSVWYDPEPKKKSELQFRR